MKEFRPDHNFGEGEIFPTKEGKIRIGRNSHKVFAYQDYTLDEILELRRILNEEYERYEIRTRNSK